jgi:uncharacterized protein YgbK (DUF1537 family)
MPLILGCIADDFTGATDLASMLVNQGMNTVQTIGIPDAALDLGNAEAVVVALKSRTTPALEAVADSLAALDWLKTHGARQFFFKYCSTFDSTDDGNIGPVADALMEALNCDFTIACPAFPTNGRTVFKGYLFVGEELLSESGMRNHPLTPMTDANLVRVLARQTPHPVGLVARDTVAAGPDAIQAKYAALRTGGARHAIVDAVDDADLLAIGEASAALSLITGGSGVAMGLPANFRRRGLLDAVRSPVLPEVGGGEAVLAGSCSVRTREQVAAMMKTRPAFAIDPIALADGRDVAAEAIAWAADALAGGPALIYSSADPADVTDIQERLGRDAAGRLVEDAMGRIAIGLVERGVRRLVVAGGETSGAVVSALGVKALRIGPEIDPGVPWTESIGGAGGEPPLALALKSGNFGEADFFRKAFEMLP